MEKPKETDVRALLDRVDFNPDEVVAAAVENSVLFVEAIQYRRSCMEKRATAEAAHKYIEAETELSVRNKYKAAGDKITEGNIDTLVLLNPKVRKAAEAKAHAESLDEYSKLVVEIFRMRRDCMKIVSDQTRNELGFQGSMESSSEKLREARRLLRDKFPGDL